MAITKPLVDGLNSAEDFVAYTARVSNPGNQLNTETAPKLLKYLVNNQHWSPFEMVHVVMQIDTTRDIAHQIVRHRSFAFQEFSQRYANVEHMGFTLSEARLQDNKNRQNSLETDNESLQGAWIEWQEYLIREAKQIYVWAIKEGIAKEVARKVLPEGLTNSRLYMAGSLRSWLHYIAIRAHPATQKEHRVLAEQAKVIIAEQFPSLEEILNDN